MDTRLPIPTYNLLSRVTLAPTRRYLSVMVLAAELSGISAQALPATSLAEIGNSALEYGRRAEGLREELIQEAEIAMWAGGAVIRLQAKGSDRNRFDVFHSYYEELLSTIPSDCPDEDLTVQ